MNKLKKIIREWLGIKHFDPPNETRIVAEVLAETIRELKNTPNFWSAQHIRELAAKDFIDQVAQANPYVKENILGKMREDALVNPKFLKRLAKELNEYQLK